MASHTGREATKSLPERVGQMYYAHGLFCSSYPVSVITVTIFIVLLCCYPLLYIPLPGNVPQTHWTPVTNYTSNITDAKGPLDATRWYVGPPAFYVQQVVMKITVSPWTDNLIRSDAFRAPLLEVFNLLEIIGNYQHENSSKTLSHVCLHVESVKTKPDVRLELPEYNCLVLSPANFWNRDPQKFSSDPNLLGTIYSYQNLQKGKISPAEILFGFSMKETGIKRYPFRNRQRILQYAVTVFLKEYNIEFIEGLQQKLKYYYPFHQSTVSQENTTNSDMSPDSSEVPEILHIYFPGQLNYYEFLPLIGACLILFFYMYFSVRKIEFVKSKFGIAFSAVAMLLASLCMTLGLCSFFGLMFTVSGKVIFPYLVLIVGLENVLVLTKSVVSTSAQLDIKIRVAQGLSREGWSITTNLLIEVTILTIGLSTFVPVIQEFCIFAIVGLLSDFFLQMFFFSTVLCIDIRRMEMCSESQHYKLYQHPMTSQVNRTSQKEFRYTSWVSSNCSEKDKPSDNLIRSKSHPKLNGLIKESNSVTSYPTNIVAPYILPPGLGRIPKRLRLVHFWARTRIFQRGFMVCMIVWISIIVYNSGIIENVFHLGNQYEQNIETAAESYQDTTLRPEESKPVNSYYNRVNMKLLVPHMFRESYLSREKVSVDEIDDMEITNGTKELDNSEILSRLKHTGSDPSYNVSPFHWSTILSFYNISLTSRYISILPAIRVSHIISPELAVLHRNPEEKAQHFQWQSLAMALDPLDFPGENRKIAKTPLGIWNSDAPFIPSSPMELFLASLLCVISVVVLAYAVVLLYRCVCTRHYAEWRATWTGDSESTQDAGTHVVLEAVPLKLEGHQQEVECLASDGYHLVSSCLAGQLRVWDCHSAESLAIIDRKSYFTSLQKPLNLSGDLDVDDVVMSDYESGSPPSRGEKIADSPILIQRRTAALQNQESLWNFPDLRPMINTNFSCVRAVHTNVNKSFDVEKSPENTPKNKCVFDFGSKVHSIYEEHRKSFARECNSNFCKTDCERISRESDFFGDSAMCKVTNGSDVISACRDSYVNGSSRRNSSINTRHSLELGSCTKINEKENDKNKILSSLRHNRSSSELSSYFENLNVSIDNSNRTCTFLEERETCSNSEMCKQQDCMCSERCTSKPWTIQGDKRPSLQNHCHPDMSPTDTHYTPVSRPVTSVPTVWCIDCQENLIVAGCSNGRLEFWEASSGKFKCMFEDGCGIGVTAVKMIGNRVVVAKLSGSVDFIELEYYNINYENDWGPSSSSAAAAYRRTHVRTCSVDSALDFDGLPSHNISTDNIRCVRLNTTRAHQQPITVLDSEGGRVLTGSQDHTLKVFRLEDHLPLFTLHGHCGPVTCMFIDSISPTMSGSGSQDGLLCVWDLVSGTCMYSTQAHDGSITALTHSASYVISLGTDEKLCFWERFQGHLLNTVQVGSLVVWDVRTGAPVRVVKLGHNDNCVFVKNIMLLRDSIACDYGTQLRIVRFPLITNKSD